MGAYFMRQIIGGIATLFLASFVIYTLLLYTPPVINPPCSTLHQACPDNAQKSLIRDEVSRMYGFDKPWPFSYAAWLFDPTETTEFDYRTKRQVAKGIDLTLGNLHIKGSGVLTGDFGVSWNWRTDLGRPIPEFFGPAAGQMFVFLISLITALMVITAAQRLDRPRLYCISATPTASALVDWWHLHATNPLDAAIINRQWGI